MANGLNEEHKLTSGGVRPEGSKERVLKRSLLKGREQLIKETIKAKDKDAQATASTIVDRVFGDLACRLLTEFDNSGVKLPSDLTNVLTEFCKMALDE